MVQTQQTPKHEDMGYIQDLTFKQIQEQNNNSNLIRPLPYDVVVQEVAHRLEEIQADIFTLSFLLSLCYSTDKEAVLNDILTIRKNRGQK
jgi:hypothetical protein